MEVPIDFVVGNISKKIMIERSLNDGLGEAFLRITVGNGTPGRRLPVVSVVEYTPARLFSSNPKVSRGQPFQYLVFIIFMYFFASNINILEENEKVVIK